jgi:predicted nucleotidyltransferase
MDDKELEALIGMPVERLDSREMKIMALRVCYNEGRLKGNEDCHGFYTKLFNAIVTPEGAAVEGA